jgi:hypothetical protein
MLVWGLVLWEPQGRAPHPIGSALFQPQPPKIVIVGLALFQPQPPENGYGKFRLV